LNQQGSNLGADISMKRQATAHLAYVAEFIRKFFNNTSPGPSTLERFFMFRQGEGSISFSNEETQEYHRCLDTLNKEFGRKRLSINSITTSLKDAIFKSFDLQSRSGSSFEDRLKLAIEGLYAQLHKQPASFTCYIPVNGIEKDGLPLRFGRVRFVIFNKTQVRNLRRSRNRNLKLFVEQIKANDHWERVYAVTKVTAVDSDAALDLRLIEP
jgi:hypothetical protein